MMQKNEQKKILFFCPFCQKKIKAPQTKAGTTLSCPNPVCKEKITIPSFSDPLSNDIELDAINYEGSSNDLFNDDNINSITDNDADNQYFAAYHNINLAPKSFWERFSYLGTIIKYIYGFGCLIVILFMMLFVIASFSNALFCNHRESSEPNSATMNKWSAKQEKFWTRFAELTTAQQERFGDIIRLVMVDPEMPSKEIHAEFWELFNKCYNGHPNNDEMQQFKEFVNYLAVYYKCFWEDALYAFKHSKKYKSTKRAKMETYLLRFKVLTKSIIQDGDEEIRKISAGEPLDQQGTYATEEGLNMFIDDSLLATERFKRLLSRNYRQN